ncbi:uncharacterized protein LOC18445750 isoform X1 [Amborella trichopoda]|uniref:uncharacterized protein LOC18445750 isoform X1 n=1 Tax=Amborella trichopoda TaxID=13333 RepID=UPI0009BD674B|nr:uncharacterized protein LOC18445750 isoform X1 [Amborella trichopoda]|eukprot:XP_020530092.1 uncharacterized protein LOC18445750 isoform X1 [Amborella trichopoda]
MYRPNMENAVTNKSIIYSLPVQNNGEGYFDSSKLSWSQISERGKVVDVAVIPFDRVDDFVNGESRHKKCPTNFFRRSTRKKNTKMGKGIDITYMCSYGRKDYRPQSTEQELDAHSDAQVQKNVRSESNVRKRRRLGRKRGCLCTFTISQLPDSHMNAVIKYRERRHVDKNGWPCHGPDDPTTREGYFL